MKILLRAIRRKAASAGLWLYFTLAIAILNYIIIRKMQIAFINFAPNKA